MEHWRKDLYAYSYAIHDHNFLSHHGILGQRWGKQNGPPYPLDASDHSVSEKKAGWKDSLDSKPKSKNTNKSSSGSSSSKISKKNNPVVQKSKYDEAVDTAEKALDEFDKNRFIDDNISRYKKYAAQSINQRGLSSSEKEAAIRNFLIETNIDYALLDALHNTPSGQKAYELDEHVFDEMLYNNDFNRMVDNVIDDIVNLVR